MVCGLVFESLVGFVAYFPERIASPEDRVRGAIKVDVGLHAQARIPYEIRTLGKPLKHKVFNTTVLQRVRQLQVSCLEVLESL
jgi:hypothetical protein